MLEQRPRIGVVPDVDLMPNRGVDYRRYLVLDEVCARLYEAGALPWVLPYPPHDDLVAASAAELHGVVLTGGDFDVDPRLYGEPPHPALGVLKPDRSRVEQLLVTWSRAHGLPLLGLCGGLQILNVTCGGTLYQHLPEQRPGALAHSQPHNRKHPSHGVTVVADTLLARCAGAGPLQVNSTHHQAVKVVGNGLRAVAHAEDGLIEAVESTEGHPFLLGVQWHPETLERVTEAHRHLGVFHGLVAAARARLVEPQGHGGQVARA